jgi:hypothetical protein
VTNRAGSYTGTWKVNEHIPSPMNAADVATLGHTLNPQFYYLSNAPRTGINFQKNMRHNLMI